MHSAESGIDRQTQSFFFGVWCLVPDLPDHRRCIDEVIYGGESGLGCAGGGPGRGPGDIEDLTLFRCWSGQHSPRFIWLVVFSLFYQFMASRIK